MRSSSRSRGLSWQCRLAPHLVLALVLVVSARKPADGARPLLLIDSGAWIEQCAYTLDSGERVVEPSAQ